MLSYTYDSMSRRTNETRSSTGARNFGYDPTGQLLQVTHPAGTATFSYDAVGNRLSVSGAAGAGTYSSNVLNQYTSAGGLGTLTYDANGNLASGGGWTYSHDSNNRLISANGPGGASASFGRDARNREVKRTLNGVTSHSIYDDWNLIAEYDSAGTLTTRYIHGPRVDDHRSRGRLGGDCRRQPAGRDERERTSQWIPELALYDYRNRTYSPALGRFLQPDPIRFDAGDVNLYRYVSNNPVNWVDPEGTILAPVAGLGAAAWGATCFHYSKKRAEEQFSHDKQQHCMASCLMTQCMAFIPGAAASFVGGILWEFLGGWDSRDSPQDISANAQGIVNAFTGNCADLCECIKE